MDHLFGFLRRKTDFFAGASQETIEETVKKAIQKQAAIHAKSVADKKAAKEREEKAKKLAAEKKRKQEEEAAKAKLAAEKPPAAAVEDDGVIEMGEDGTFDVSSSKPAAAAPVAAPAAKQAAPAHAAWSLPEPPASVLEDAREESEKLKAKEDEEDKEPARKFVSLSSVYSAYVLCSYWKWWYCGR